MRTVDENEDEEDQSEATYPIDVQDYEADIEVEGNSNYRTSEFMRRNCDTNAEGLDLESNKNPEDQEVEGIPNGRELEDMMRRVSENKFKEELNQIEKPAVFDQFRQDINTMNEKMLAMAHKRPEMAKNTDNQLPEPAIQNNGELNIENTENRIFEDAKHDEIVEMKEERQDPVNKAENDDQYLNIGTSRTLEYVPEVVNKPKLEMPETQQRVINRHPEAQIIEEVYQQPDLNIVEPKQEPVFVQSNDYQPEPNYNPESQYKKEPIYQQEPKPQPEAIYQPEYRHMPNSKYQQEPKLQPESKFETEYRHELNLKYQQEPKPQPEARYQPESRHELNPKYQQEPISQQGPIYQQEAKYQPESNYQPALNYQPDPNFKKEPNYQPDPKYRQEPNYQPEARYQPAQNYQQRSYYQSGARYQPEPNYQPDPKFQKDSNYQPAYAQRDNFQHAPNTQPTVIRRESIQTEQRSQPYIVRRDGYQVDSMPQSITATRNEYQPDARTPPQNISRVSIPIDARYQPVMSQNNYQQYIPQYQPVISQNNSSYHMDSRLQSNVSLTENFARPVAVDNKENTEKVGQPAEPIKYEVKRRVVVARNSQSRPEPNNTVNYVSSHSNHQGYTSTNPGQPNYQVYSRQQHPAKNDDSDYEEPNYYGSRVIRQ